MKDEVCILGIAARPYDFQDKDGNTHSGISYKIAIAVYEGGAKDAKSFEIAKIDSRDVEKVRGMVGRRTCGRVLYDRFGRFAGIG